MLDPEYVRVLDRDTGHTLTLTTLQAAHGNLEVLDESPFDEVTGDLKPTVHGTPPPVVHDDDYDDQLVDDLKTEIAARNEGRDPADLIQPAEPGNKPQLVEALRADDQKENV